MKMVIIYALMFMIVSVMVGMSGCGGVQIVIKETPRVMETDTVVIVDPPVVDYRSRRVPRNDCWRYRGCYGGPYHGYDHGYGPYPYYYPW